LPSGDGSPRPARAADLDALVALETAVFETDRLSRRSFRRLLASPTAICLVAHAGDGGLAGYALLLFRRSTALARLYSIAVDPRRRGQGVARCLMAAAEEAAYARGAISLRLEVRADNAGAVALYRARGYRQFGRYPDYYQDHAEALRFEKLLTAPHGVPAAAVPFYEQQTGFTCGPACIMMAMAWRDSAAALDLGLELALWREATTIFMTSGHGGCDPFGIAVALRRRGFWPHVHVSHDGPYFLDGVRDAEKRRIMEATESTFRAEARALGIPETIGGLPREDLIAALDGGALVMILVSGYRMFRRKVPHWLLAVGHDANHLFVHDPWVEKDHFETAAAAANLPIPLDEFDRMARYSRDQLRAAIVIRKEPG
jgi:ribosomal protein S18 acetylase RimI-like enzyme